MTDTATRAHVLSEGCWCEPLFGPGGSIIHNGPNPHVFEATFDDPIDPDGFSTEDHR